MTIGQAMTLAFATAMLVTVLALVWDWADRRGRARLDQARENLNRSNQR